MVAILAAASLVAMTRPVLVSGWIASADAVLATSFVASCESKIDSPLGLRKE
jgi:hypothetical protein